MGQSLMSRPYHSGGVGGFLKRPKCIARGCPYIANSDACFRGYCCHACGKGAGHGHRCEKILSEPTAVDASTGLGADARNCDKRPRCSMQGCPFLANTAPSFRGRCCHACARGAPHGERCERILAPDFAEECPVATVVP